MANIERKKANVKRAVAVQGALKHYRA
ncbi:hypothetical protein AB9K36_02380 [Klebsiella michiganensis]